MMHLETLQTRYITWLITPNKIDYLFKPNYASFHFYMRNDPTNIHFGLIKIFSLMKRLDLNTLPR